MKLILAIALLAALATAVPVPFKNCGKPNDVIKLASVDSSTWPPVRGKPLTVSVKGNITRAIQNGDYQGVVKFNGFPILDKRGKLSELRDVKLPIPAGTYQQSFNFTVPSWVPAGQIDVHATLFDNTGAECICLDISIPLKMLPPEQESILSQVAGLPDVPETHLNVPIPWKNCGGAGDLAKITQAVADVWPPVKGKPISFSLNATLSQALPDATYEAKVKFNGIQLIDQKGKISDFKNVTLPIPAGPYGISKGLTVPGFLPSGQYDIHVEAASTASGKPRIACIEITAKIA